MNETPQTPQTPQTPPANRPILPISSSLVLAFGAIVCTVFASLAQGRLETVKLAYGFLVITGLVSALLAFLGLRNRRRGWARFCLVMLVAAAAAVVYAVRMMSLAYTFQMNLY